jgi:uncharacterized membrane protein
LTLNDIGTLGGEYSYAWDINDQGLITGEASTAVEQVHAFLGPPRAACATSARSAAFGRRTIHQ